MRPEQLILSAAIILVVGAAATAAVSARRRLVGWVAVGFVTIAGLLALPAALGILIAGGNPPATPNLLTVPVLNAQLIFRIDALSALFILISSVISFLTTLYSVSYMTRYEKHHLARYYPPLLLFFASILGLICAADWFFFIIFWELMSVCSYALTVFENDNPVSLRAGFKYVIMTHAATSAMFIAIIVLWQLGTEHSFTFEASRQTLAKISHAQPALTHVLLALWLIGFGTKAGMLPFGSWLPDAYPAAPTAVSAAFGGSTTKLGIYGLLRVFCWMLPPSGYSETWGMVIALLGAGSVFVGTLSTLPEHVAHDDTKRFLSFHVIGQIGYMLLGLGIGIYFLNINPLVATLALMATVFHLVNNVCYKSLLYLNAGSILYRTNTRDLNQVSGLGAIMPLTALTATVGALSIAGMPPLNGFASKWMLYSVSILSPQPMFPVFVILGVMAMFISLVTLASFLKFIGAAFLGTFAAPKNNTLDRGDVPLTMQIPQVVLAGLCILFGLVPVLPLFGVHKAISAALPANMQHSLTDLIGNAPGGVSLMLTGGLPTGIWLPLIVFAALLLCMGLSKWIYGLGGAVRRTVSGWNCGVDIQSELVRYQARSFYGPFKKAFGHIYPTMKMPKFGYPRTIVKLFDVDHWLYAPLTLMMKHISERVSRAHVGIPQMYLIWQVAGAALVLTALFLMLK